MAIMPKESMTSISGSVLPDELVREILTWLPVKSLMRFKCVSKLWLSLILEPAFALMHRQRGAFRGILIFGSPFCRRCVEMDYFYLRLDGPVKEISHHLTLDHGGTKMGYTNPVNGVVCFYHRNRSFLYNLATREILQLPVSRYESQFCTYHLGFDPVNNWYKVVKICPVYINYDDRDPLADELLASFVHNLNCEVLTIGKDSPCLWRSIDSPPPWDMRSRSVCYDGVLYWCEPILWSDAFSNNQLIAFDLFKEEFFIFPMPSSDFSLMPFGPGLCLERYGPNYLAQIICYHGRDTDGGGGLVSFKLDIRIPETTLSPMGMLPDGKVFFSDAFGNYTFPPVVYFLYDPKKKEFEKIVIPEVTPSPFTKALSPRVLGSLIECGCISYFEENIVSFRHWTSPIIVPS